MAQTAVSGRVSTKVFISYSRRDRQFVSRIVDALEAEDDIEVFRDTEDILPTEEWKARLEQLIAEADTVIFALSPHSAKSDVCRWEIDYAESLNKRIAPIVIRDVKPELIPEPLTKYNYIFFNGRGDFDKAVPVLIAALNTDIEWIREHTRLGEIARRWEDQRKLGAQPLRGRELEAAEQWLAVQPRNAPNPTELHRRYISDSRRAESRRQRNWVGGLMAASIVTAVLAGFAFLQMQEANLQRGIAVKNEKVAVSAHQTAKRQRNEALIAQSRYLSDLADRRSASGDAVTAILLGLEGLNDERAESELSRERPYVGPAEVNLYRALVQQNERAVFSVRAEQGSGVTFSPDRLRVAISLDNSVQLWDLESQAEIGVLTGHEDRVSSVTFSGDQSLAVTTSSDGTARVWDTESAQHSFTLEHLYDDVWVDYVTVQSALISSDSSRIVTSSANWSETGRYSGVLQLWNANDGKQIASLGTHNGVLSNEIFSPDGSQIVTTSCCDTPNVWDLQTGRHIGALDGHEDDVLSAAFSPNGGFILTTSRDGTVRLWDAALLSQIGALEGHESAVYSASFSRDGRRIVTLSEDGTARLWNSATKAQLAVFQSDTEHVSDFVFSPDGSQILLVGRDGVLRSWNTDTGSTGKVGEIFEHGIPRVRFSSDGARIIILTKDGALRLWDALKAYEFGILRGFEDEVLEAVFSPDGSRVISVSGDKTLRVWDVHSVRDVVTLEGHTRRVMSAVISSDGKRIATSSVDGTARVWDAITGHQIAAHHAGFTDVQIDPQGIMSFSPDGKQLLTVAGDGTMRQWDSVSGEEIARPNWIRIGVLAAEFSPDSSTIVSTALDGTARLWDAETGAKLGMLQGHEMWLNSASFSPDGSRIVTASVDNTARIWDATTMSELAVLRGHADSVNTAKFSPDGTRVATASGDGTARVWDVQTGHELLILNAHNSELDKRTSFPDVSFSPDGGRIVTANFNDGVVRLWDVESGNELHALSRAGEHVVSASFFPDGRRIAAASRDAIVSIWDVATGTQVAFVGGQDSAEIRANVLLDGNRVVTASYDGTARVWRVFPSTVALMDFAKTHVPRCLTLVQRSDFNLPPDPPAWCIDMGKWPYDTDAWRLWLVEKRAGGDPEMPE